MGSEQYTILIPASLTRSIFFFGSMADLEIQGSLPASRQVQSVLAAASTSPSVSNCGGCSNGPLSFLKMNLGTRYEVG